MPKYLVQVHEYNTYSVEAKDYDEAKEKFYDGNYTPCPQKDDGTQVIETIKVA